MRERDECVFVFRRVGKKESEDPRLSYWERVCFFKRYCTDLQPHVPGGGKFLSFSELREPAPGLRKLLQTLGHQSSLLLLHLGRCQLESVRLHTHISGDILHNHVNDRLKSVIVHIIHHGIDISSG